jgi:hypothetical protein
LKFENVMFMIAGLLFFSLLMICIKIDPPEDET